VVLQETSVLSVHFSSEKMDWETPQDFFDELDREFNFDFDVCATHENSKVDCYLTPDEDALTHRWPIEVFKRYWMNPPYGREIGKWMKKAYEESQKGCTVVCLVPSRTDTKWWVNYAMKAKEIRLVTGRLKFKGAKNAAPFPSAVIIFDSIHTGNEPRVVCWDYRR